MTVLLTADLHLTDNPRDADRWNLFPWLQKQITKTGAKHIIILGDLTDAKDKHPSTLVNRFVRELETLAAKAQVIILKGNHDYIDEKIPFFDFTDLLHNVLFITSPAELEIDDGTNQGGRTKRRCLFLPSTRDHETAWKPLDFSPYFYIFCHQTFDGSLAENGMRLGGVPPSVFKGIKAKVWSGDIHTQQQVSQNIEHVGAPYRIDFGDPYTPRVVLLKHGKAEDLHFPAVRKELLVINQIEDLNLDLPPGSQVKVRAMVKRADHGDWPKMRRQIQEIIKAKGWDSYGIESERPKEDKVLAKKVAVKGAKPQDIVKKFAADKKLSKELATAGQEFLKE